MNQMNVSGFDLNLVRVFLAVWELRSLTAAGDRLGLTQPAISHALRRLRERFDDPLFVRTGRAMVPTDAAARLHEPLERAYGLIRQAVQDHGAFAPQATERCFRVAMSDVSEIYFLPRLTAWLEAVAPRLRMDVVPLAVDQIGAMLRVGEVDLAIGHLPEIEGECVSRHLLSDRLLCMVRAGHPVGETLDREAFAGLRHIHAGASAPGHHMVDHRLAELDMRRSIALRVGHLTVAPDIVRTTDLAVIYPGGLARSINADGAFRLLPLPFDLPSIEVKTYVHPRFAADPGIGWLLDGIAGLFRSEAD
jgi:DNA-binding transcriptional LysR family regulator